MTDKRPPLGELIVYLGTPWELIEHLNCNQLVLRSLVTGSTTQIGDNHAVPISDLHLQGQANLLAQMDLRG